MEVKHGYKQTEVGVIPDEWEVYRLEQLSEFVTSGSRGWAKYYCDSGPIFVRSQNIRDGCLDLTERQCVSPPAGSEVSRTRLNQGDLLITVTGNSVGNVAWVGENLGEAYISQHVGLVRLSRPSLAEYTCRFLSPGSPGNWQILASQAGQSKPGLNLKDLGDFRVVLPPLPEQRAITTALSDIDALLGGLDQLITKKRDLKQGVMQQLLTGQTRLPGFYGSWSIKKIGSIGQFEDGDATTGGELGYIEIGDVDVVRKTYNVSQKEKLSVRGAIRVPSGTLLISTVRPTRGAITITKDDIHVSNAFCRLRISNKYLFYMVCQDRFLAHLGEHAIGGTYPTCRDETILDYKSMAPDDPAEQTAIAVVLADMDIELSVLEARRDKIRVLKQAMMQELLTGKTRLLPAGVAHA